MKFIPNKLHGVLDYSSVYLLLVAPYLFEMDKPACVFSWVLAAIHLLLTLTRDFSMGIIRIVPVKVHAAIELLVAISLVGVAVYFFQDRR